MSEQKGRCYNEMKVSRDFPTDHFVMADAIDRLAADVAAIKAKVDAVSPDDVRHFVESEKAWVKLVEEQRDAAIRERDEARAEVERLKAIVHSDAGHMAKILIENERLRAAPAAPQPAGHGISPGLPQAQSTGNAVPPPGWLTDEEKRCLPEVLDDLRRWGNVAGAEVIEAILVRAGSPPSQTAPWWLTEEERAEIKHLLLIQRHNTGWTTERHAELDRLLARAGSPPVVEVPAMPSWEYTAHKEALAYRAAMDKAGVAWKEVGRG